MGNGKHDRLLPNICKRLHERLLTTKDETLPFSTPYFLLPTPDFQDRFIEEEAETGTKRNDASFLSTQHSALSTQKSDRFSNGLSRCGCKENAIAIVSGG